jgi:hypothetical protein
MAITTNTFAGAPADLLTAEYSLADIPIEYFVIVPRAMFDPQALFRSYHTLNYKRLTGTSEYIAMEDLTYPAGFSADGAFNLHLDATDETVGTYYAGAFSNGVSTTHEAYGPSAATYPAVPGDVEFVYQNTTTATGDVFSNLFSPLPYKAYAGFRPMGSAPADTVFIDNLGFAGSFQPYAGYQWDTGSVSGARAQFAGVIKRDAMGKTAADLVDADIVMGCIVQGTSGRIVIDGDVVWERSDFPLGDNELDMYMSCQPTFDQSPTVITPEALDTVSLDFKDCYVSSNFADFGTLTPFSGTRTVSFANAVVASINDTDFSSASIGPTQQAGAAIGVGMYDYWDGDAMFGSFYTAGPTPLFWTQRFRATEVP